MTETSTGRTLPVYNAVDSSATPTQEAAIQASLDQAPGQINFLSDLYGPYPFDSTGAVADRAAGRRLRARGPGQAALRGRLHRAATRRSTSAPSSTSSPTSGSATASRSRPGPTSGSTRAGRTGPSGTGTSETQGGDDPAAIFDDLYANTPDEDWEIAPAILDGDPANLFAFFPTYQRGRDDAARGTARSSATSGSSTLATESAGPITATATSAPASSSPRRRRRAASAGRSCELLDDYFQQWLYGEAKPTILPDDFA